MTRELIDREENLNIYIYIYIENSKYFNTHTHTKGRGEKVLMKLTVVYIPHGLT